MVNVTIANYDVAQTFKMPFTVCWQCIRTYWVSFFCTLLGIIGNVLCALSLACLWCVRISTAKTNLHLDVADVGLECFTSLWTSIEGWVKLGLSLARSWVNSSHVHWHFTINHWLRLSLISGMNLYFHRQNYCENSGINWYVNTVQSHVVLMVIYFAKYLSSLTGLT